MFIKHDQFMDVAIEVRSWSLAKDAVKIYGSFWNLGQSGKSFSIGEDVRLKLSYEALANWKQCVDATEDLRTSEWTAIKL